MATVTGKIYCVTCGKEKVAYKCEGCAQNFCLTHLGEHHQLHVKQLDDLDNQRNMFRQILSEQSNNPQKYSLIQQINRWENDSIKKIQQTAEETRESILKYVEKNINEIEIKLRKLTEELKQIRQEDDFNEIHLNQFKERLNQLDEELKKPSKISIQQDNSSSFINKISIFIISEQLFIPNINMNTKWIQNGITVAGGNQSGNGLNQLSESWGVYVNHGQTIYIADTSNNRIVEWKKGAMSGKVIAGENGKGDRNDQLNFPQNVMIDTENDFLIICDSGNRRVVRWPRQNGISGEIIISDIVCWGLAMDNDGYLYISDVNMNEVRRWKIGETHGTLVAGGNGSGNSLNQLNGPRYIFVDQDQSVYISDIWNHRVVKWIKGAKEGIIVAGGQGQGNDLKQLSCPHEIIVDQLGSVYVTDFGNHRVMRWPKGAKQGNVIVGGNGPGAKTNQLSYPVGLSIDRENNLYILDRDNYRIQKFPTNYQ